MSKLFLKSICLTQAFCYFIMMPAAFAQATLGRSVNKLSFPTLTRNGVQDGPFIDFNYSRPNPVVFIGYYCQGHPCGTWYGFNPDSTLGFEVDNIVQQQKSNRNVKIDGSPLTYQGRYKSYRNGFLVAELTVYFDHLLAESFAFGKWYIYKEGHHISKNFAEPEMQYEMIINSELKN